MYAKILACMISATIELVQPIVDVASAPCNLAQGPSQHGGGRSDVQLAKCSLASVTTRDFVCRGTSPLLRNNLSSKQSVPVDSAAFPPLLES